MNRRFIVNVIGGTGYATEIKKNDRIKVYKISKNQSKEIEKIFKKIKEQY